MCLFAKSLLDRTTDRRNILATEIATIVTARLVNPGGQLVNPNEETEESEDVIEPPILPEVPFSKK